jgi:hypothetical protein
VLARLAGVTINRVWRAQRDRARQQVYGTCPFWQAQQWPTDRLSPVARQSEVVLRQLHNAIYRITDA